MGEGGLSTKWCESDLYFNSKMNYLAHFLIPLRLRVFTLLCWQRADPSEILITFYSLLFTSLLHLTPLIPSLHSPLLTVERNANKFAVHLTREEAC